MIDAVLTYLLSRDIDDVCLTWNESLAILHQMLDEANSHHPNIKFVRPIAESVPLLDMLMENQDGFAGYISLSSDDR